MLDYMYTCSQTKKKNITCQPSIDPWILSASKLPIIFISRPSRIRLSSRVKPTGTVDKTKSVEAGGLTHALWLPGSPICKVHARTACWTKKLQVAPQPVTAQPAGAFDWNRTGCLILWNFAALSVTRYNYEYRVQSTQLLIPHSPVLQVNSTAPPSDQAIALYLQPFF